MYPYKSRERMSGGEFCNKFTFRFFFSLIGDTHLFVDVFFFFFILSTDKYQVPWDLQAQEFL